MPDSSRTSERRAAELTPAAPVRAPDRPRAPPRPPASPATSPGDFVSAMAGSATDIPSRFAPSSVVAAAARGFGNRYASEVVATLAPPAPARAPRPLVRPPPAPPAPAGVVSITLPALSVVAVAPMAPGDTAAPAAAAPTPGASSAAPAEAAAAGAAITDKAAPPAGATAAAQAETVAAPAADGASPGGAEMSVRGSLGQAGADLLAAGEAAFQAASARIDTLRKNTRHHKPTGHMVGEAKAAVQPPAEENQAEADAAHIEQVGKRTQPTPAGDDAVVTRDAALLEATPKTLEQMDDFRDSGKADAVRAQVLVSVRGAVGTVNNAYGDVGNSPPAPPPAGAAGDVPGLQTAARTGELTLGEGIVPPIPAKALDMSEHKNKVEEQMQQEGIAPETLAEVDSGPLAEARGLREDLHRQVDEGPAQIRQEAQTERDAVHAELAGEERTVREGMKESRKGRLGAARGHQTRAKCRRRRHVRR